MHDLALWLTAQLDADTAEIADPYAEKAWHARDCESVPDVLYPGRETGACDCGVPAQVLREIEMKRSLVAAHERRPMPKGDTADCAHCWGAVWPCPTLRLLASVYDGRPGYQESWRP